jgi:hypothetical protein
VNAIRTEALTKRCRTTLALDRLDLSVEAGEVYGYLGPNGASHLSETPKARRGGPFERQASSQALRLSRNGGKTTPVIQTPIRRPAGNGGSLA